jgi:8-oxo-dGTP diphosphatase
VRLRKRNEWVLPKGKLDDGETPRAAAEREVNEETGHDVFVHEFLGTLVYESGGRSKIVHYWRMEASGEPVHELMSDVKAVDWLPLAEALERLSRGYERAFLENVGPIALSAAALAATTRRPRAKPSAPETRRSRRPAPPSVTEPTPLSPSSDPPAVPAAIDDGVAAAIDEAEAGTSSDATPSGGSPSFAPEIEPVDAVTIGAEQPERRNLIKRMRDWLRRAA